MGKSIDDILKKDIEIEFDYMWRDKVVAHVYANARTGEVRQQVIGNGGFDAPIWHPENNMDTLYDFFESRCFPRERYNCEELLKLLDLTEYNPYLICLKTRGRQWSDYYWIRFKGDKATFDKIKLRD